MFAVKSNTLSIVPTTNNDEMLDPHERLRKVLAEAKAREMLHQAEINAAREAEAYHRAMHSEVDQMLKGMTKVHNDHNIMSAQIKLGLVNNTAKLIARMELNDTKISELENQKNELEAQRNHEITKHALTKNELERLSYSKMPFFKRIISAALGKRT